MNAAEQFILALGIIALGWILLFRGYNRRGE